jgi:undecaprenyl-diphosphatase
MLDGRVEGWVDTLRTDVAVDVAKLVTHLGSLPVVGGLVLIAVALLAWRRRPYELFVLLFGSLLVYAAVHIAKGATDRPRPPGSLVDTMTSAFPSGHAAYSVAYVAMGVIAARVLPGRVSQAALVIGTVVVAAAVGATRVYLGAHYYSDVVAGWSLAAFVYAACAIVALVVSYVRQNGRYGRPAAARPAAAADHG